MAFLNGVCFYKLSPPAALLYRTPTSMYQLPFFFVSFLLVCVLLCVCIVRVCVCAVCMYVVYALVCVCVCMCVHVVYLCAYIYVCGVYALRQDITVWPRVTWNLQSLYSMS